MNDPGDEHGMIHQPKGPTMRYVVEQIVLSPTTIFAVRDSAVDMETPVYVGMFGDEEAANAYAAWLNA